MKVLPAPILEGRLLVERQEVTKDGGIWGASEGETTE